MSSPFGYLSLNDEIESQKLLAIKQSVEYLASVFDEVPKEKIDEILERNDYDFDELPQDIQDLIDSLSVY